MWQQNGAGVHLFTYFSKKFAVVHTHFLLGLTGHLVNMPGRLDAQEATLARPRRAVPRDSAHAIKPAACGNRRGSDRLSVE